MHGRPKKQKTSISTLDELLKDRPTQTREVRHKTESKHKKHTKFEEDDLHTIRWLGSNQTILQLVTISKSMK